MDAIITRGEKNRRAHIIVTQCRRHCLLAERLWICAKHRHDMGKNWRPCRTCMPLPVASWPEEGTQDEKCSEHRNVKGNYCCLWKTCPIGIPSVWRIDISIAYIKCTLTCTTVTQSVKTNRFFVFFFNSTAFFYFVFIRSQSEP